MIPFAGSERKVGESKERVAPTYNLSQESFAPRSRSLVGAITSATSDIALGKKIAHGMVLTFGSGKAEIHIRKTPIKPILESLKYYSREVADSIERYQMITGVTPSKPGLRVFSMVLKKLADEPEARQAISRITDEALAIELNKPEVRKWKTSLQASIDGLPVTISLSLEKRPILDRILSQVVGSDLAPKDRNNRFGYRVEITPATQGNRFLALVANRARQLASISCLIAAPAAVTVCGILAGAPPSIVQPLIFAVAIGGYFLQQQLSSRKLLSQPKQD